MDANPGEAPRSGIIATDSGLQLVVTQAGSDYTGVQALTTLLPSLPVYELAADAAGNLDLANQFPVRPHTTLGPGAGPAIRGTVAGYGRCYCAFLVTDGRSVGFSANFKLKRAELDGAPHGNWQPFPQ